MIHLYGRKRARLLVPMLFAATLAEAQKPPLPHPDSERGSIALAVRAITKMFGEIPAVEVYFVRLGKEVDAFSGANVIPSSFSKEDQVYLLNAKPGRYVAVAAVLGGKVFNGALGSFAYQAFFSMEMIPETEITVKPGQLVFAGDFVVSTSTKMSEADSAQAHYLQFSRTMSGKAIYTATLKTAATDDQSEREFWSLASKKVFMEDPAWLDLVQKRLESLPHQ